MKVKNYIFYLIANERPSNHILLERKNVIFSIQKRLNVKRNTVIKELGILKNKYNLIYYDNQLVFLNPYKIHYPETKPYVFIKWLSLNNISI